MGYLQATAYYQNLATFTSYASTIQVPCQTNWGNRLVVVGIHANMQYNPSYPPTFNLVPMTYAVAINGGGYPSCTSIWYMLNPPVGTFNAGVTFSNAGAFGLIIVRSFFNVAGIGAVGTDGGTKASTSITVASQAYGLVFDVGGGISTNAGTVTAFGTGQGVLVNTTVRRINSSDYGMAYSSEKAGAASITMTESFGSRDESHCAIAIVPYYQFVPPTVSISANYASRSEGNSGTTAFTFTVTRGDDLTQTGSVNYSVSGSVNAADFVGGVLPSGTVNFAVGQASATITINVAGDVLWEGDESFTVTLSGASNCVIGTASASSSIINDDSPPQLWLSSDYVSRLEVDSGSTTFTFTVTRTGSDISMASSVNYAVTGGTANAADFVGGVLPSGTVNFAANQATATITINVAGDNVVEPDESFTVTLSSPVNATIGTASASATILNDDTNNKKFRIIN